MTNFEVVESATLTLDPAEATGKRWRAVLIKPGWGAKAYYTEEALRVDGPKVFKAGTPIFIDHMNPEDKSFYQFGKVANLAGELATDAVWDSEEQALTAEVEIFEHEMARVKSIAKRVGLSVRALVTGSRGTMEGRSGQIATGLVGAKSVDLVVRAGAGGQLLEVLESDIDIETEEQQMSQEILDAIAKFSEDTNARFEAFDSKITQIEESLTAVVEAETATEAVTGETAAAAETAPVLTAETISELIAAEFAKIKPQLVQESAEHVGTEENANGEVEESATATVITTPRQWAVKGDK